MLGISMTGSTLAGLMNSKIKFAVDQNMPIINKLNPAALITDAFYCINVYDDPGENEDKSYDASAYGCGTDGRFIFGSKESSL